MGFADTCATQGAISLRDFFENAGIPIISRYLLKESEKSKMLDVLIEDPPRSIKYAMNDLVVYDALLSQDHLVQDI